MAETLATGTRTAEQLIRPGQIRQDRVQQPPGAGGRRHHRQGRGARPRQIPPRGASTVGWLPV
jgi:hypothetical protein